jgi:hypothetical protein
MWSSCQVRCISAMFAASVLLAVPAFGLDVTELAGIYALGEGRGFAADVTGSPEVDGLALRYSWTQLEPREGVFNWSGIDRDIASARRFGKKISIGVTAGARTPRWVYLAGARGFTYTWDRTWGFPVCSARTIPIPWDPVYLSKWGEFVKALGARYSDNPALAYVKITGINGNTQELILPHSRNRHVDIDGTRCETADEVIGWQNMGYTRRRIEQVWERSMMLFAQSFPGTYLGLMIGPRGFPPIDDTGNILAGRGADVALPHVLIAMGMQQLGSRFVVQNNGLSAVKGWHKLADIADGTVTGWQMAWQASDDRRCRMNGGKSPCDPREVLGAAIERGIASGASFIEIYSSDIQNPRLSDIITAAQSRLHQLRRTHGGGTRASGRGGVPGTQEARSFE